MRQHPSEEGLHRKMSRDIELIQLPIVPLSLFSLHPLHITTTRKHAFTLQCRAAEESFAEQL
jgi:hypothetical protein